MEGGFDFKEVNSIPITSVMDELGIEYHGQSCRCPLHTDNHASGYIMYRANRYKCLSCGFEGSVLDFVAKVLGINNQNAANWVGTHFDVGRSEMDKNPYDPDLKREDIEFLMLNFFEMKRAYNHDRKQYQEKISKQIEYMEKVLNQRPAIQYITDCGLTANEFSLFAYEQKRRLASIKKQILKKGTQS